MSDTPQTPETPQSQEGKSCCAGKSCKGKLDLKLVGVAALVLVALGGVTFVMNGQTDLRSGVSPVAMTQPAEDQVADETAMEGAAPADTSSAEAPQTDATNGINPSAGEDAAPADESNPVVARINDREIRRDEVMPVMQQALESSPMGRNIDPAQVFPFFIDQYVSGELVLDAAKESGIENDPAFKEQMDNVKDQVARNVYLVKMADKSVTDEALKKLYQDRIAKAPDVEEVHARHILVKTEEEAKELIQKLKDGGDFNALAEEHTNDPSGKSNGGDLGFFAKQDMVPEFAEAAFKIEPGKVSDTPVKTQFGWHVIKVEEKRNRPKPSFEEVRSDLEEELRKTFLDNYLRELRDEAKIEMYDYNGKPLKPVENDAAPAEAPAQ